MLRDVTPERFNRIEKELVRGKNEINRRLVSLSALFERIAWLYTELGIALPSPGDPTPSSQEFPYPRAFRSAAAGRQDPFTVTPAPDPERQRREYFPLFAMFVSKLQEVEEGQEVGGIEGVDPTLVLVEWFEHLKTDVSAVTLWASIVLRVLSYSLKRRNHVVRRISKLYMINSKSCGSDWASLTRILMTLSNSTADRRQRMSERTNWN